MYKRTVAAEIQKLAKQYPVVTLTGPRQSGKTTLVKALFPDKPYVNLESLDICAMALNDPRGFLSHYPKGAILDEIQRAPDLLSYIQVFVDESQEKGFFILTESHQLHSATSQSLAGRCAIVILYPMSLEEISKAGFDLSLDEALFKGGYPRVYHDNLDPTQVYRFYFQTYVEKDLRDHIKNLSQFQRFIKLLASRVGQLLNLESIGDDAGISSHTVREWVSILEASYVIFRLQPYFENFGKRIIKSSKIYFSDVGFLSYLLGLESVHQLARDPLRGHIFENFIILELMKSRLNLCLEPNLYFFRDTHGHEVDLIVQKGRELLPIEIKSTSTFHTELLKNLIFFKKLVEKRCEKGYLIYTGLNEHIQGDFDVIHFRKTSSLLVPPS